MKAFPNRQYGKTYGPIEPLVNTVDKEFPLEGITQHNEEFTYANTWFQERYGAPGDHLGPNSYFRLYREIEDNQPYVREDTYTDYMGRVSGFQRITAYLSGDTSPGSYRAPDGAYAARDNMVARMETKARSLLRGAESTSVSNRNGGSTMQLGASMAESKQSLGMLAGVITPVWGSLNELRRGNVRKAGALLGLSQRSIARALSLKTPASKWLEFQYGWRPLVSDAYTLYGKLSESTSKPQTFTIRKGGKTSWEDESNFKKFVYSFVGHTQITARVIEPYSQQIAQYGLENPLSIAWELVPFSFVLDWGIPIGNVLESMTATMGLEFVSGYTSVVSDGKYTKQSDIDEFTDLNPNGSYYRRMPNRGQLTMSDYGLTRTVLGGFPLPKLYGNENPFSTARIANAVALFRNLFS